MIETVANLLDAISERERSRLDAMGVKHRPTIGGMYERLTADILAKALPTAQPLSVVSGFIRKTDGSLSRELDCILVLGDVEPIPYSDKVICNDLSAVIAVIQVKKGLYAKDVAEGHENLRDVRMIEPGTEYATDRQLAQAFETIARTPLVGDVATLPPHLLALFRVLRVHLNTPCCILLGYHGYSTHKGFRTGLAEHLKSLLGKANYGPLSLPDVILNQQIAAVKNVSLPWNGPLNGETWPLYLTSCIASPHIVLLDALWTRLVFRQLLSGAVFGEDLEMEQWTVLSTLRYDAEHDGWNLATYEHEEVEEEPVDSKAWSPAVLSHEQFVLVNLLCLRTSLTIQDLSEYGLSESDIMFLRENNLVARDVNDPTTYRLITQQCRCCILPDGRFVAADDNSGRLTRWVSNFCKQRKSAAGG